MPVATLRTDDELLSSSDPEAFGVFYDRHVKSLLAELPPDQRGLISAHVIEERSYDELAGELDTSEAALRQRVSRSLSSLRRRRKGARG